MHTDAVNLRRQYRSKSVRGKSSHTDGFHRAKNSEGRHRNDMANAGEKTEAAHDRIGVSQPCRRWEYGVNTFDRSVYSQTTTFSFQHGRSLVAVDHLFTLIASAAAKFSLEQLNHLIGLIYEVTSLLILPVSHGTEFIVMENRDHSHPREADRTARFHRARMPEGFCCSRTGNSLGHGP